MNFLSPSECVHPHVNVCCVSCRTGDKKDTEREENRIKDQKEMKIEADRQIFHMAHCSLGPGPDVTRAVFIC